MGPKLTGLFLAIALVSVAAAADEPAFLIPSARTGNSELFLIDPVKGDAKNISQSDQSDELYPAFSPDGKRIAFTCKSRDHDFEVYASDADGSNRKRLTTAESPSACFTPSWSADGKSIVYLRLMPMGKGEVHVIGSGGSDDRVVVKDALGPAWSPDGKSIAFIRKMAGKASALCLMNPDGSNMRVLTDELGPDSPFFPAWSPDGKFIAMSIGTEYGWQIALIPAAGGPPRQLTYLPGFNLNPVWIAADRLLFAHTTQPGASSGGYASIKADGTRLAIHPLTKAEPPHAVGRPAVFLPRMTPKPEAEVNPVKPAAFLEPGTVKKLVIKATPVSVMAPAGPGAVSQAVWAADSKRIAFALEAGVILVGDFDGKTIRPVEVFRGHEGPVDAVAMSADGKFVYSTGADKTVRTWDISTKGSKSIESDHQAWVDSMALSGNGKWLATGDRDGKLKIRNASNSKVEQEIAVCDARRGSVQSLAFSKANDMLFAGSGKWNMPVLNGAVSAYDPNTGKQLWRTKGTMGGVFSLALSPDGTRLAGACLDTFVRIWDAKTGEELSCWKGHSDRATGVAWGLGGKVLVSCSFDHTVRVWDASNGTILQTLSAHASPVIRVAATPDGKHVVSTGQVGAICIWKLDENSY